MLAAAEDVAGKDKKATDSKAEAGAEADPPRKPVVKPRRDRKVIQHQLNAAFWVLQCCRVL